ncbi:MAG: hypothetical protein M1825_002571 [Sarcosagium campestre]|nr:MAG: hypothetical protein M1825_002571 [Sarcosagium campestre]
MSEADNYDVLEKIGHGSFGIIRKVKRKSDGHVLCRKEISYVRMSNKEREQLHAEFSILNSLNHPNIVAYYHREHFKATQDLHLYMEYCGNGDLGRVIKGLKTNNQFAQEEFVWSIFAQLVTALYRCHYGVDPPAVGRSFMSKCADARPKLAAGKGQVMILHRDLKPENVFLGEDNSVKLGDFGLSKIMQSHDFASTYVGTPFYMSPEICAAELYTLHSDIWSLGCIMYELCAREPPFNAKTHLQLVQKIKEGKVAPLPKVYSSELQTVIKSCLRVNPLHRPDTAALLDIPVVRLMRKEKEVVSLVNEIRISEANTSQKLREAEEKLRVCEADTERARQQIDASVRREWEVKATLEINQQVRAEQERLKILFDAELQQRVQEQVELYVRSRGSPKGRKAAGTETAPLNASASISTSGDTDFPSTTDLTEFSMNSPPTSKPQQYKTESRTPFGRSQTMYAASPMDVQMVDPSPMRLSGLSLSPRRNGRSSIRGRDLFARPEKSKLEHSLELGSDEDDDLPVPSPTRQKASNVFKVPRPPLVAQKTAPLHSLTSQPDLFSAANKAKADGYTVAPSLQTQQEVRSAAYGGGGTALRSKKMTTPNRRISKIPSSTNLNAPEGGSPTRRARQVLHPASGNAAATAAGGEDMIKAVTMNNMKRGKSFTNLAAVARGGERPIKDLDAANAKTKGRLTIAHGEIRTVPQLAAVVWDPEKDEMPSPFLVRHGRNTRIV